MSLFQHPFDPSRDSAIVTGAGNGIGAAIARALVGEGLRVVVADLDAERVRRTIEDTGRPDLCVPWIGDLSTREGVAGLLSHASNTLGRANRLVHAASPPRREADTALTVSDETWVRMRAVNVDAGFHLAREQAKELIAAEEPGSFLLVTSLHAGTPRNLPHYSTAKAAMAMLVKELAKTFGRFDIRVNALVPGAIAAGGFVADPALARHIPLGRLGRSDDLAPMALALLSDRISGYVTGAAFTVDGGLSLMNWFEAPEIGEV
jgi:3-oxoacyl-[acyl-carrier protein] reductase